MDLEKLISFSHHYDVIIYDGVCVLCNRYIHYAFKHDKNNTLMVAPLQSNLGKMVDHPHQDTVYLFRKGKKYTESDVGIEISKNLSFPHNTYYLIRYIPKFIRDIGYRWVAKNRYRWFGKKDTCMILPPDFQARVIDFPHLPGAEP